MQVHWGWKEPILWLAILLLFFWVRENRQQAGGIYRIYIYCMIRKSQEGACKIFSLLFFQNCEYKSISITRLINIQDIHEGHKDFLEVHEGVKKINVNFVVKIIFSFKERHIPRIHECNKNYKCETCTKSYAHTADLKLHIQRSHADRKDYKWK